MLRDLFQRLVSAARPGHLIPLGDERIRKTLQVGWAVIDSEQTRLDLLQRVNEIPGVSCVKPEGALYAFPRLDPEVYDIADDEQLVLDLLLQEKILVTQGTGFNWPAPDHLRIVTLPWSRDLTNAIERLGNFLASYRQ